MSTVKFSSWKKPFVHERHNKHEKLQTVLTSNSNTEQVRALDLHFIDPVRIFRTFRGPLTFLGSYGRWLAIFGMVLALKQFYSAAHAAQLQWILYPLVLMLELFSDMNFQLMPDYAWLDQVHQVSIVKGCAGINFLIISLLAHLWSRHQQAFNIRMLLRAFLIAWLCALCANTLRVLLCIYGQNALAAMAGISEQESHRAIGIAVYFLCLWAQLASFSLQNLRQKAVTALIIYVGITLFLPYIRAYCLGLELPETQHVLWVLGLPSIMVMLTFGWWRITREGSDFFQQNKACNQPIPH